jgi:two-component system sensor histidine kinase/response regulator
MPQKRTEAALSVAKARADFDRARTDLDRAYARMDALAVDDRQRSIYSAHAFSNYLMVVTTMTDLIRRKATLQGDREAMRWLDSLKRETNRMMIIARGVLTATSDALPPLLSEPSSLAEIAEGVCVVYRDVARKKRIRVTCKGPAERDSVITDRVVAGAVLDNLLSNAVKFSQVGTAIHVTTTIRSDQVVCSVLDHGPGLSEADQAQLFQRGMRLSAQPTAGESSTGHGLAIANDLANALGGRLTCTSVFGHGSCFTFSLPLAQNDAGRPG